MNLGAWCGIVINIQTCVEGGGVGPDSGLVISEGANLK